VAPFDNSYARLPSAFFVAQAPANVAQPKLVKFNTALAEELGLELAEIERLGAAAIFSGNTVLPGAEPIAMAYAGHQFGHFVPRLGDGRAILLGEVIDRNGVRRDIQLKGAGRTPFSRGGDGRAALGPVLREYLVSEAMHALSIPATRALAAVVTGEMVNRDRPLPGAVLTRIAASHIRVGTFQYFAARGEVESVRVLADYVIARHYPEAAPAERPYLALLEQVIRRQAALIARWLGVGFIHGVMNTDNMAISGETIDFGPCAFMDEYDPATVYSAIDEHGRYAYANQPRIGQWNLSRFAETLVPLIDADEDKAIALATEALSAYGGIFQAQWLGVMRRKIGLQTDEPEDEGLIQNLLGAMQAAGLDYTLTFRRLCGMAEIGDDSDLPELGAWLPGWRARLAREAGGAAQMRAVNPAYIPRNHLVEQALNAAIDQGDFAPFEAMLEVLSNPFDEQPGREAYSAGPREDERVLRTFCGT
jgi:uncharacterized protein YdiU (UPF0061 family)